MTSHARRAAGLLVAAVVATGCGAPSESVAPASAGTSASPSISIAESSVSVTATPSPASPTPDLARVGGTWETGVKMPSRRAENAAVALDGRIYLAGGLDPKGNALTTFEAFDTATGTWSTLPP